MLAPDVSPVHFWRNDADAIEIKGGDLRDLKFAEFCLLSDDATEELDILSLSPIKNKAVLNLMHRFKQSRGVPASAASTRRKIQSLKIAKALDDLTCITETPTRLSICRQGSICNFNESSPVSPTRSPASPAPARSDPELKYLFEVLGASTPFMHTPPPASSHQKSVPAVKLCMMEDYDFLNLTKRSESIAEKAERSVASSTPVRPRTGIPTPSKSAARRAMSAPPKRSPAVTAMPSPAIRRADISRQTTPAMARAHSQSPSRAQPSSLKRNVSPRPALSSPRSTVKKVAEIATPIRTSRNARMTPAPPTPRSAQRATASTVRGGDKSNTPSYLRPTQNSMAARSPSPNRNQNDYIRSPASPVAVKERKSPRTAAVSPPRPSPAKRTITPSKMEKNTPEKQMIDHLEDENISPNVTSRPRHGSAKKSNSPPVMDILGTPRSTKKSSSKLKRESICKLMAERETENDFFNTVMASCDDILAQLDAAVSKGPKPLMKA